MQINRQLIAPKCMYFLLMAAISSFIMYFNMLLIQKGLTPFEIGIVDFVAAFLAFLSRPIVGSIVDRFKIYRKVIVILLFLTTVAFTSVALVSNRVSDIKPAAGCNISSLQYSLPLSSNLSVIMCLANSSLYTTQNSSMISKCMPKLAEKCSLKLQSSSAINISTVQLIKKISAFCSQYQMQLPSDSLEFFRNVSTINESYLSCKKTHFSNYSYWITWDSTFLLLFLAKVFGFVFFSPVMSILDAITFSILGDKHVEFGHTRLFGSVGFLVFALVTGFALYGASNAWSVDTNYLPSFIILIIVNIVGMVTAVFLKVPDTVTQSNFLKAFGLLFLSLEVSMFFLFVLTSGVAYGVMESFFVIAIHSMVKSPHYFFGINFAVMVTTEVPMMFLSGRFINCMGELVCIMLGLFATCVRFFFLSISQTSWHVLASTPLHGVSFGLALPAMLSYANKKAPQGLHGTIQGLVSGLFFGVAFSVGSIVTGILFNVFGARGMLRAWSVIFLAFVVIFFIYILLLKAFNSPTPPPNSNSHPTVNVSNPNKEESEHFLNPIDTWNIGHNDNSA